MSAKTLGLEERWIVISHIDWGGELKGGALIFQNTILWTG